MKCSAAFERRQLSQVALRTEASYTSTIDRAGVYTQGKMQFSEQNERGMLRIFHDRRDWSFLSLAVVFLSFLGATSYTNTVMELERVK